MSELKGQHVPHPSLPLAMQANRSAITADDDRVRTMLAAVSRILNGADTPIQSYLHEHRAEDQSLNAEADHQRCFNADEGTPIPPRRNLIRSRCGGESPGVGQDRRSGDDLYDCSTIPSPSYLCQYGYGGESAGIQENHIGGCSDEIHQQKENLNSDKVLEQEQSIGYEQTLGGRIHPPEFLWSISQSI